MSGAAVHPYPLTALTVVLGPPVHMDRRRLFDDFQRAAVAGEPVADHAWPAAEHDAVAALIERDGTLNSKTLIETWLGGVLRVNVIVADVDLQWVSYDDQRLYASLTVVSEDVRPRAAAVALHEPTLVNALNAVAESLATIDGREWIRWSSRTWHDEAADGQAERAAVLVQQIAATVLTEAPTGEEIVLADDLVRAIIHAREAAGAPNSRVARELRSLRLLDPLRTEWNQLSMDAFYLASLDPTAVTARVDANDARGLAYLYLGQTRIDRLKADPAISPRFRAELAARTWMTAYALERLAPTVSRALHALMVP